MKVGILTDIHLGAYDEKDEHLDQFADTIQGDCDVLVLSGDLASTDPLETESIPLSLLLLQISSSMKRILLLGILGLLESVSKLLLLQKI